MKKYLKFHFPKKLRTYTSLFFAGVLTVIVITFFLQISEFLQYTFKYLIQQYPLFGIFTPLMFMLAVYSVKYHYHFVSGSGIPQAFAALRSHNKSIRNKLLSFRIAIGKIALIFFAMLFGAPIGIEGPSIHIGSSIFYNFQAFINLRRKLFIHALITIGAAAGLIVAFNAPLAGLAFAYEEMGKGVKKQAFILIVAVLALVYFFAIFYRGNDPYLLDLNLKFDFFAIFQLMPLAIFCGIFGGIFAKITIVIMQKIIIQSKIKTLSIAFILGSVVAFFNYLSMGLVAGSGHMEVMKLLGGVNIGMEFLYMKYLATLSSLVSGIPGGLFMPSISIGGAAGAMFSNFSGLDPHLMIVFGMIAYLSAVIRAPITSVLVVIEMTSSLDLLFAGVLLALLASFVSSLIHKQPLYSALAESFDNAKITV